MNIRDEIAVIQKDYAPKSKQDPIEWAAEAFEVAIDLLELMAEKSNEKIDKKIHINLKHIEFLNAKGMCLIAIKDLVPKEEEKSDD